MMMTGINSSTLGAFEVPDVEDSDLERSSIVDVVRQQFTQSWFSPQLLGGVVAVLVTEGDLNLFHAQLDACIRIKHDPS